MKKDIIHVRVYYHANEQCSIHGRVTIEQRQFHDRSLVEPVSSDGGVTNVLWLSIHRYQVEW